MFVSGWCYHRERKIIALEIRAGPNEHQILTHSMPRSDVYAGRDKGTDPHDYRYHSGFWTILPLEPVNATARVDLELVATLSTGDVSTKRLASITLESVAAVDGRPPRATRQASTEPLIAICMTTYNPKPDLFRAQIASLREQTHENWICVVSDDRSRPDLYAGIRDELDGRRTLLRLPAGHAAGLLPQLRARTGPRAAGGGAGGALRPRRSLAPRQTRGATRGARPRDRARLLRHATSSTRAASSSRRPTGPSGTQPHQHDFADGRQHDHGRRLAFSSAAARLRAPLPGSAWSGLPRSLAGAGGAGHPAGSPTSIAPSTTTCSTPTNAFGFRGASWKRRRRRRGGRLGRLLPTRSRVSAILLRWRRRLLPPRLPRAAPCRDPRCCGAETSSRAASAAR